jgi:hypothetical protein
MTGHDRVENTLSSFSLMYLGGIPSMMNGDSAFLSFICVLTATEALAGYRYSDIKGKGERFKKFVSDYFPVGYDQYSTDLWAFRNSMVHAFAPARFALMHHHSECHLRTDSGNGAILNAEDFYGALLWAAQKFFTDVRSNPKLRELMLARLQSPDGGGTTVVAFVEPNTAPSPSDAERE